MPRLTQHTALVTSIHNDKTGADVPFLAIQRAKLGGDGEARKTNGGIWVNLQPGPDRPLEDIVKDLADARAACEKFIALVDQVQGIALNTVEAQTPEPVAAAA